ncbi:trehalase family glycosidase [soil metagenome]
MDNALLARLTEVAAELLRRNTITVGEYRYTAPSLDDALEIRKDYANQFLWDSCFHAVGWRWIDPARAADELIALLSRQVASGPDAGMIPHCNYWRGGGTYLWGREERSLLTQPPLIGIAALLIHERSGDRAFLEAVYAPLCRYHDWFDRRRDADHDGLVSLIHPWESGGDALPRWDAAMGLDHPTYTEAREARLKLASVVVEHDGNAELLEKHGYFTIEPMDFNAIRGADLDALATIAELTGRAREAEGWRQRAERVRLAMRKMVIDGEPYDLAGRQETPVRMASAGQFITLINGSLTKAEGDRLVARLAEPRFATRYPVPTSPTDDTTFAPDVYWRGNVWPSTNWLIHHALFKAGYKDQAAVLAESGIDLLDKHGFCEYYDPLTGQGLGGINFSWCAAFLDMARRQQAV